MKSPKYSEQKKTDHRQLSATAARVKTEHVKSQYSVLFHCQSEQEQQAWLAKLLPEIPHAKALLMPVQPFSETPPKVDPAPLLGEISVRLSSPIVRSPRVAQCQGMFSLDRLASIDQSYRVQFNLDRPWHIGAIVGPSGTGKSTIARALFGEQLRSRWPWPKDRSLLDGFPAKMSLSDIIAQLAAVGFASPPDWLKPFGVLSNGQQFRVHLARTLAESPGCAVIDEYSSVIDRTVAKIASHAAQKAVRRAQRQLVAVTCHYDVLDWLQPDWVYDTREQRLHWRSLRPRPNVTLQIYRVAARQAWPIFQAHHYLSHTICKSAISLLATVQIDERPPQIAALASCISNLSCNPCFREHRTVCLPDYQGIGLGNLLSEYLASLVVTRGKKYFSTTSHPAMIAHRLRSPLWHCTRPPMLCPVYTDDYIASTAFCRAHDRFTAGFQYVGPSRCRDARAFGLQ